MSNNPWSIDPWDAARQYYERRMHEFMAALMRQVGVTQIALPYSAFKESTIEMRELPEKNARFYRIVGEMKLEKP